MINVITTYTITAVSNLWCPYTNATLPRPPAPTVPAIAVYPNIDIIALMTRDADFLPIINKAKENGKETIVIGAEPGFSAALQNSADDAIILKPENHKNGYKRD